MTTQAQAEPDSRPWSEKYSWVFPVAIIGGVVIIGYAIVAWAETPSSSSSGGGLIGISL